MSAKKTPFIVLLIKIALVIVVAISTTILTFGVFAAVLIGVGAYVASTKVEDVFPLEEVDTVWGDEEADKIILSLPVSGLIVGDEEDSSSPLGLFNDAITYGYDIKKELYDAAANPQVAAVVIEINSPGGTIYGSRAIADGMRYVREVGGKPAYAFISGLAASGGYWAALGADHIAADYGSVIGSIGVISGPFKYYEDPIAEGGLIEGGVLTQSGIQSTFITAGRSKDLGNPYRELSEEEVRALQTMVDNQYSDFVTAVSSSRNIPEDTLREDIGAMIYDTASARENGLIDEIATRDEAYAQLATRAGIEASYRVVRKTSPAGLLDLFLGASTVSPKTTASCMRSSLILAYFGSTERFCWH